MTKEQAARDALDTHDALVEAQELEPDSDTNPDAWLGWHENISVPAYKRWSAAMDELNAALNEKVSRHPWNFRPICEKILHTEREPA
jgi:hypothetical protein